MTHYIITICLNLIQQSSMKNRPKPSPPMIQSLIFVIQPLSLLFKQPSTESYLLQFDRGAQTIKKYSEEIRISADKDYHEFSPAQTDMIKLKLQSEHDLSFEWELYKMTNKVSTFVDSIPVNLMEYYRIYVHSIIKSGLDCQQFAEDMRKGRLSAQKWEIERQKLQWEFSQNVGKNTAFDIEITYRLQIWNEFDVWCESQTKNHQHNTTKKALVVKEQENLEEQLQLDQLPSGLQLGPRQSSKQYASPPQSPKNSQKRKHFQPITMLKRNSALSEIIECSNECSSIINYGQRYAELQQISGIPEQQEQSPYVQSGESFRRSNTVDSNIYSFPQPARSSRKVSTPQRDFSEYGEKDDRLGRMETQPQSLVQAVGEVKEVKPFTGRMNGKLFIVAIVCILAIGMLVYFDAKNVKNPKSDIKKPAKKTVKPQPKAKPSKKQKLASKK